MTSLQQSITIGIRISTWSHPLISPKSVTSVSTFFPFKLLVEIICSPRLFHQSMLRIFFLRFAWSAQPCSAGTSRLGPPYGEAILTSAYHYYILNLLDYFRVSPHLLPLHRLLVLSSLFSRSSYTQPIGFDL
jgi:hypothetical protein